MPARRVRRGPRTRRTRKTGRSPTRAAQSGMTSWLVRSRSACQKRARVSAMATAGHSSAGGVEAPPRRRTRDRSARLAANAGPERTSGGERDRGARFRHRRDRSAHLRPPRPSDALDRPRGVPSPTRFRHARGACPFGTSEHQEVWKMPERPSQGSKNGVPSGRSKHASGGTPRCQPTRPRRPPWTRRPIRWPTSRPSSARAARSILEQLLSAEVDEYLGRGPLRARWRHSAAIGTATPGSARSGWGPGRSRSGRPGSPEPRPMPPASARRSCRAAATGPGAPSRSSSPSIWRASALGRLRAGLPAPPR
ncbi:MAG: hypothetical protein KatS3mg065_0330 [Chloroflexota bacterium]|nr:MAG: hypothetical protein KatS3mg065_0330 [Chloroflexota bacterium]